MGWGSPVAQSHVLLFKVKVEHGVHASKGSVSNGLKILTHCWHKVHDYRGICMAPDVEPQMAKNKKIIADRG